MVDAPYSYDSQGNAYGENREDAIGIAEDRGVGGNQTAVNADGTLNTQNAQGNIAVIDAKSNLDAHEADGCQDSALIDGTVRYSEGAQGNSA